jgi:hypothetical protein
VGAIDFIRIAVTEIFLSPWKIRLRLPRLKAFTEPRLDPTMFSSLKMLPLAFVEYVEAKELPRSHYSTRASVVVVLNMCTKIV